MIFDNVRQIEFHSGEPSRQPLRTPSSPASHGLALSKLGEIADAGFGDKYVDAPAALTRTLCESIRNEIQSQQNRSNREAPLAASATCSMQRRVGLRSSGSVGPRA